MRLERIIGLYKITNLINGKAYIGQSIDPNFRWKQHCRGATNYISGYYDEDDERRLLVDKKMGDYGISNFIFENIATCWTYEDANDMETLLIIQHGTHVSTQQGYNILWGGSNAPKSEEWKQMLRNWHASLSPEEKAIRNKKLSDATIKQIATQGHPALGTKRTPEQRQKLSDIQQNMVRVYTDEQRAIFAKNRRNQKDTEETKKKRGNSVKLSWSKRLDEQMATGEYRCHAPGCEINGRVKYRIVNGIRYCETHASRLIRNGSFELKVFNAEERKQLFGHTPHNKIIFTEDELIKIRLDDRPVGKIAKEFEVGYRVIKRIKTENK
jgi:group I intron endonuclease